MCRIIDNIFILNLNTWNAIMKYVSAVVKKIRAIYHKDLFVFQQHIILIILEGIVYIINSYSISLC